MFGVYNSLMPNYLEQRVRMIAEVGLLPRLLYRLELNPESKKKIADLRVRLAKNPEMALVVYFNHFAFDDPLWMAHLINRVDPGQRRHIVAPASFSHIDPGREGSEVFRKIHREARRCGIETIPIIQAYQVDNPDFGYTEQQAYASYKKLLRRLKELKESGVSLAVIVSPEGHRSETGVIGEAEEGIVHMLRLLSPAICVPVGIVVQDENPQRGKLNFGKKVLLNVGNFIVNKGRQDASSLSYLMEELASLLPKEKRGRWDLDEI